MSGNSRGGRRRRDLAPIPPLASDAEAERFAQEADLTRYDLSGFRRVSFEFAPKDARITLRLPAALLQEIRREAEARGMRYQRLIRELLERGLEASRQQGAGMPDQG